MTPSSDLKFVYEPPRLSPEAADALNAFAAENPLQVARHANHTSLARDIPFIFHPAPVPLHALRPARGRTRRGVTVVALLAAVGSGVYVYRSNPPFDLDILTAWASRFAIPRDAAMTPAATPPTEARPTDPPPTDPPIASNESVVPLEPDRSAVTDSARPQSAGVAGSLAAPARSVSGAWHLETLIETSDSSLENLNLHYDVTLKQDGNRVSGVGTKVSDNDNGIGRGTETPVTVTGTVVGDRLTLNFVERGTETRGRFVLVTDQAGTLRGRFSSSAAQSSGHVEARRVQFP